MKTILIPDRSTEAKIEKDVFGAEYNIITLNASEIDEIDDKTWASCDGMLCWHDFIYTEKIISKLTNCKGIVRIGTGFDNIDLGSAKKNNIVVSNVPDYGTNDVADHTWALILSLERGVVRYNQSMLDQGPWSWELGLDLNRIQDKTLGIIGFGRIGTAVAVRAKSFGMNVLFYDPYVSIGIEKALGISRTHDLDELLGSSEIVTIHTPLTNATKSMVNKDFFKKMKKGSSLYNTARGEIIVMDDLYWALKNNTLKFVGLDVLETEPANYKHPLLNSWINNELWIKGRLAITPHAAFYNIQSYDEMRQKAAEELKRILEKKSPLNQVN